jgi:hypothetical protein
MTGRSFGLMRALLWNLKKKEGRDYGLMQTISSNFVGKTEQNTKNLCKYIKCKEEVGTKHLPNTILEDCNFKNQFSKKLLVFM